VQTLLSPEEFVRRAIGIPWVRWRSDWFACDCYGLVLMWLREVHGINPGTVPQTDIVEGFHSITGWHECGPDPGATGFMTWRDGAPTHCGVLVGRGQLLHAQEGHPVPEHGSVRATRLDVMARACPDIRFYRYEAPCR
jgi:cell wall-associated NlpC family hydrolase